MGSPTSSASEKTESSPETEKIEASPESEIECACQNPTTTTKPSLPSPPSSHLRKQSDTNTFESPPPPKRSKSISKQKHASNLTPLTLAPRFRPKKSTLEVHKAALKQGAFIKNLEFWKKLSKQLSEPWATHYEHSFSTRQPPKYTAYTERKIREYHASARVTHAHSMENGTSTRPGWGAKDLNNARKDMQDWREFEKLEMKYREEYGLPPPMQTGDYFGDKEELGKQLGSFEWVTRTTVAPLEGEEGLGLHWIDEHPVLPFLDERDRMRMFRKLDKRVRDDVLGLEKRLKGIVDESSLDGAVGNIEG